MNNLIKIEELALFISSYLLSIFLGYEWWLFLVLLFLPDISIAGYVMGNRKGAIIYNIFHHKGIAILILVTGYFISSRFMMISGLVLFGHSSLDRALGYGLKMPEGFKSTHLGQIK